MAYITKNANLILLFLIVISAAALVGATVLFQENFDRINKAYTLKLSQLQQVSKDLEEKQAILASIKDELALKAAREEEFTSKYTEVRGAKETLEGEKQQLTAAKESLESELIDTERVLQQTQNTLEALKGENEILKGDLAEAQADVARLKDDKDDLQDQLADKNNQITALNNKVSCLQGTADADEGNC